MWPIIYLVLCGVLLAKGDDCKPSITTASGPNAPQSICSGQLIFDEPFDNLDKNKWKPVVSFSDFGVRLVYTIQHHQNSK